MLKLAKGKFAGICPNCIQIALAVRDTDFKG